jgi:hypothetical protein
MAVNRIEVAIDCDEPMSEGVDVLIVIAEALGLDVDRDVSATLAPSEDGTPILIAVLTHNDDDEGQPDAEG